MQLAVRGKLVSQKPNDEPALSSLNRAKIENEFFQQTEIFARDELDSFCPNNRSLATIPHRWEWVSLVEVVDKGKNSIKRGPFGSSIRKEFFVPDGYKVYEQKNAIYDDFQLGYYFINEKKFQELKDFELKPNDIIISCSGTIGRIAVAPESIRQGIINQALLKITLNTKLLSNNYFKILFPAFFMNTSVLTELKGTAIKNIVGVQALKQLLFPLPPIAEQKRIVEKCDRLLSICDEIEKRQQQRQESILRMNESAIAQLLSSQNPDEFRQHWQRIRNNFDLFYSVPETIPKLRQAILQLAVQGKLVRQEFDESALRYLIERITEERLALCPNEKDKQRILSEFGKIIEESAQGKTEEFEIPAICICDFITKGTTPSNSELLPEGEIPYLKVYNIVDNKIDFFYKPTYISRTVHTTKLKRSLVCPGDVLMNIVGPPLGKIAIVPDDFPEWNINQALAVFRPVDSVYNRFMYYALSSYATLEKVLNETKGTAGQDNLSLEQCRSLRIPLYTIETQKRIVEKCDRLMSLCDTLEAKLKQGRDSSEKLMEVAAKQVLTA
ncbi:MULTISPECIES: restriction endonuclease subunit S [Nostocales]|uniref:restriction endonuclease subunit S n=1 Tax=Nostocales TaxID=1161 RepID=UPI001641E458|nr:MULTISPECIES: restriction endonuclease subunit S [Nostocales]